MLSDDGPDPSLDPYLFFAEELALWAMDRIGSRRPREVATKSGPTDLVTETDRDVEWQVSEQIRTRFPSHRVVGEEFGTAGDGADAPSWYVDPVDGTMNFVHGLPWSSFSLALARSDHDAVVGVVADPYRREVFSAARGRGARLNGVPIRCSDATSLAGEMVLTEWAGNRPWPNMHDMLAILSARSCSVRIMGSSALSIASMAAGRAVATVLGAYSTWDALAGALIAREAGARILARDGTETLLPPEGGLLAAAPGVADELWKAWNTPSAPL
ncbi:MAG: inositol monophosphatase family protein [Streptosporangiaceae bacterium]